MQQSFYTRFFVAFSLFVFPVTFSNAATVASTRVFNDAHLHFYDFLQRSDGVPAFVAAMDETHVQHAFVSGMPFVKKWASDQAEPFSYYLESPFDFSHPLKPVVGSPVYWYSATDLMLALALTRAQTQQSQRFHPLISGFNSVDRNAADHVKRMVNLFPEFWQGIGEVMGQHDDLTALTYGKSQDEPQANHIALKSVYKYAGENNLFVLLHNNISDRKSWDPIYLSSLNEVFKEFPETRFLWAHGGISRGVSVRDLTGILRGVLQRYNNVWIDISWVVFEQEIVPDGKKPQDAWITLFEEFPDRFLIGSDAVGRARKISENILRYNILLNALKPQTAEKIAQRNFWSLLKKNRI